MGAIDSFISSMNRSEGFARAASYEVVFKFPVGISVPSRGQQLSMHCNTISWPGHDLQVQARKHASEPTRNLVQSHAFEGTIDAIFYLSADHRERFLLEQWQELAVNRYTHKANYYNEYVGAMEIYQLGAAKATRTFTTEGAPIKGNPHIDKEADKHSFGRIVLVLWLPCANAPLSPILWCHPRPSI